MTSIVRSYTSPNFFLVIWRALDELIITSSWKWVWREDLGSIVKPACCNISEQPIALVMDVFVLTSQAFQPYNFLSN